MIYADFNHLDDNNHLLLNCVGSLRDIAEQNLQLVNGMPMTFYTDDADEDGSPNKLLVNGVLEEAGICWVGVVDWDTLRHERD